MHSYNTRSKNVSEERRRSRNQRVKYPVAKDRSPVHSPVQLCSSRTVPRRAAKPVSETREKVQSPQLSPVLSESPQVKSPVARERSPVRSPVRLCSSRTVRRRAAEHVPETREKVQSPQLSPVLSESPRVKSPVAREWLSQRGSAQTMSSQTVPRKAANPVSVTRDKVQSPQLIPVRSGSLRKNTTQQETTKNIPVAIERVQSPQRSPVCSLSPQQRTIPFEWTPSPPLSPVFADLPKPVLLPELLSPRRSPIYEKSRGKRVESPTLPETSPQMRQQRFGTETGNGPLDKHSRNSGMGQNLDVTLDELIEQDKAKNKNTSAHRNRYNKGAARSRNNRFRNRRRNATNYPDNRDRQNNTRETRNKVTENPFDVKISDLLAGQNLPGKPKRISINITFEF